MEKISLNIKTATYPTDGEVETAFVAIARYLGRQAAAELLPDQPDLTTSSISKTTGRASQKKFA
jgi:hypothetical protein